MKKFAFLAVAAIAVMSLASCDKDDLNIVDPQATFFRIVDSTHVDLYDQGENVYQRYYENSFSIAEQMTQNRWQTTPLVPLEDLDIEIDPFEMERKGNAIVVKVRFNHFTNSLNVYGLHFSGEDALGDKFYVACLSDVFLRGKIIAVVREEPFLQVGKIHYTLYTVRKGKEIVLAQTDQEFRIFEDLDDIEF